MTYNTGKINRLGLVGVLVLALPLTAHAQVGAKAGQLVRRLLGGKTLTQQIARTSSLSHAADVTPLSSRVEEAVHILQRNQVPQGPLVRSTFIAHADKQGYGSPFSGAVFKTTYHGQEEIFGVVAAHALSTTMSSPLGQTFTARVYTPQGWKSVPAQVVQYSAPSMLDMVLVKFRPEDEKLFEPLSLSLQRPEAGETLQTQGFALGKAVFIPNRTVVESSQMLLLTRMPFNEGRNGLCGSPVTNEQNELVGIHTGSSKGLANDVGYAVPAAFLPLLVRAYHQPGREEVFPLVLDGRVVLQLKVDEYISEVRLSNALDEQLAYLRFGYKFPYHELTDNMLRLSPRYIEFYVRKVAWTGHGKRRHLEEKREGFLSDYTVYKYDTLLRRIVSEQGGSLKQKMMEMGW